MPRRPSGSTLDEDALRTTVFDQFAKNVTAFFEKQARYNAELARDKAALLEAYGPEAVDSFIDQLSKNGQGVKPAVPAATKPPADTGLSVAELKPYVEEVLQSFQGRDFSVRDVVADLTEQGLTVDRSRVSVILRDWVGDKLDVVDKKKLNPRSTPTNVYRHRNAETAKA